jgi:hypothetical protein
LLSGYLPENVTTRKPLTRAVSIAFRTFGEFQELLIVARKSLGSPNHSIVWSNTLSQPRSLPMAVRKATSL